jgi:two-component system response regulator
MTSIDRNAGNILKNKKILLVDDNQDDLALTIRAFNKLNFSEELMVANDGTEALEYLFGRNGKNGCPVEDMPLLVLLDLKMPKINGLEVLREIKASQKTRLIPVVMFTSSCEERDIIASRELGANEYIQKPVNFSNFTAVIRQLVCSMNLQPISK